MDRDFRYFALGQASRFVLAGGLFAVGLCLQVLLPSFVWLGGAVIVAGCVPLALRKATNKPDDQGREDWRAVSAAEFDRLDEGLREAKKLRKRTTSFVGGFAMIVVMPILAFFALGTWADGRADIGLVAGDLLILLVPAVFFGRVSVFTPGDIAFKMPSFRAVLAETPPSGVAIAPYIRFDKDSKGGDVPEDLRLMFELKRPPTDFVGIQIQAAVNKGPNGNVPYLYAVILTRGKGPSYRLASAIGHEGYEVEPGGDDDYGAVVVRQKTGGTGYHTTPEDCHRLAKVGYRILETLN
ncbi:MAG: hypothetical protein M0001_03115 [Treponema sp.]|nr:hypothetical protein [Treponema sp.]